MRAKLLSTVLVMTLASSAAALKVNTDHDVSFDFSAVKTVAWTAGTPAADELMQKRIVAAVEQQLLAQGLEIVEGADADLLISTHVSTDAHMKQSGGNVGVSVSRRTKYGSIGVGGRGNQKVSEVKTGTLLIDMTDPRSGELVWRANASDTVEGNSDKMEKKINTATEKAFKDYPPKVK